MPGKKKATSNQDELVEIEAGYRDERSDGGQYQTGVLTQVMTRREYEDLLASGIQPTLVASR